MFAFCVSLNVLQFAKELRDRIQLAVRDFPHLKKPAFETEEALRIFKKCNEMIAILSKYEGKVFEVSHSCFDLEI